MLTHFEDDQISESSQAIQFRFEACQSYQPLGVTCLDAASLEAWFQENSVTLYWYQKETRVDFSSQEASIEESMAALGTADSLRPGFASSKETTLRLTELTMFDSVLDPFKRATEDRTYI